MNRFFFTLLFLVFVSLGFAQTKAERLFRSKQWESLHKMKTEAKTLSGKDLYRVGLACMNQEEDTAAIRMFKYAIKKGYQKGDLYYNLGIAYNQVKFYNNAIEALNNALYLEPRRKPYMLEKAASFYQLQQPDSALAIYKNVQTYYPKNQFSAFMTCKILHEEERMNDCLKCYYGALHKFKDNNKFYRESLEAIVRLEWHYKYNFKNAEVNLKKLKAAYPKDVQYNLWLVQLLLQQNKFDEATPIIKEIELAYTNNTLPNKYYKKGNFLIDAFEEEGNYFEVFKWFRPKNVNKNYSLFVFGPITHKPIGAISVLKTETGYTMIESKKEISYNVEEELTYKSLKQNVANFLRYEVESTVLDSNAVDSIKSH